MGEAEGSAVCEAEPWKWSIKSLQGRVQEVGVCLGRVSYHPVYC